MYPFVSKQGTSDHLICLNTIFWHAACLRDSLRFIFSSLFHFPLVPYFSHLLLTLFHLLPCIQMRCFKHTLVQGRCILNKSCVVSVINVKNIYTKITSFFGLKTMLERKTVSPKIIQDSRCRSLEKEGKYVKDHSSPLLSFYERSGHLSFYRKCWHVPKVTWLVTGTARSRTPISWLPDQCSLDQTILSLMASFANWYYIPENQERTSFGKTKFGQQKN